MVVMRMGQDYRVQFVGRNLEVPVFLVCDGTDSLEGPAIDEDHAPIDFQYML